MLAFSENKLPKSFLNEIERRIAPNRIILRSNVKNLNDCNEWVKEFGILTNTNWNTRSSKPENSAKKMICSKKFVCHHSSFMKIAPETNKRSFSKNSGCLASITMKVKLCTVKTKRNDPFVKKGLCAVITINDDHNHSLNAAESLKCLPADVCKEKFIDYFNEGMGVAKACKHHQAQLKLRDDISEEDLTNNRINPTNKSVQHWFNSWRLQKLNPKQGKIDDNSKIDCNIEAKNNGEGDKKANQSRYEDAEEPKDGKAEQSRKEDIMQPRDGKAEESGNKDTIPSEAQKAQQSRKEDILQSGDEIAEKLEHEDAIQPEAEKAQQSRKEDIVQSGDGIAERLGHEDTIQPGGGKAKQSRNEDIVQSGDGIAEQVGHEDAIQPGDGKAKQSRNKDTDQPGSGKAEQSADPKSSRVKDCSGEDIKTFSKKIGRRRNTQHPSKRRNCITEHWILAGQKKNLQANSPSKEIVIKEEIEIGDLDQALNRQDILNTLCPPLATEDPHPPYKRPRHSQLLLPQQNDEGSASTSISTIKSEENCSDGGSTSFSTLSQQQNEQHESSTQFSTINPVQNNINIPNTTCSTMRLCSNEPEKTSTSFSRMNLRCNRRKAPIGTSTLSPCQNHREKARTGTSFPRMSPLRCNQKKAPINTSTLSPGQNGFEKSSTGTSFSTINCQQSDRDISNSTSLSTLSLHQNEATSLCSVMPRNTGKTTLSFSNKNFQRGTSDTSNALFFTNQNKCDKASMFSTTNPLQYELIESNSSYSKMSPHRNDRDDTSTSFYDGHEDDVDMFFKQIATRVKKLSPELINQAKMASVKMLIELENKSYN